VAPLPRRGPRLRRDRDRGRGLAEEALDGAIAGAPGVRGRHATRALDRIFGKRVIVVGGGAQIAQVALGAVSEADRHNLRGERISVDTIPSSARPTSPGAVRAVADLPRARLLVLAGSIMGGEISAAADELRALGDPPSSPFNMAGSITDHVDLVVSDPVQAGTMAVDGRSPTRPSSISPASVDGATDGSRRRAAPVRRGSVRGSAARIPGVLRPLRLERVENLARGDRQIRDPDPDGVEERIRDRRRRSRRRRSPIPFAPKGASGWSDSHDDRDDLRDVLDRRQLVVGERPVRDPSARDR